MSRALPARMDVALGTQALEGNVPGLPAPLGSAGTCFLQDILHRVWTLRPSRPAPWPLTVGFPVGLEPSLSSPGVQGSLRFPGVGFGGFRHNLSARRGQEGAWLL